MVAVVVVVGSAFTAIVNALVDVHERMTDAEVHVQLTNDDGMKVFGTASAPASLPAGERVHVRVKLENPLNTGRYYVDVGVHRVGGGMLAYRGRARDFLVVGGPENAGLVAIPHAFDVQPDRPRADVPAPRLEAPR